jgi:nucleoside 2-deoxyribosyltransferase
VKKLVYLAGPYSAPTQAEINANVRHAATVASVLWNAGYAVICPHMNTYGMEGDASLGGDTWADEFKKFLTGDFEMINRCDMVVMLPGWETSKGACAEFAFANWLELPVYIWPDFETILFERGE